jgi:hypothetical protein
VRILDHLGHVGFGQEAAMGIFLAAGSVWIIAFGSLCGWLAGEKGRSAVRAAVSPGWRGVVTATGGYVDFVPPHGIQEAIDKKRSQLRGKEDVMLAINLGGPHVDSHSWSMEVSREFRPGATLGPTVDAPTNVLGVLAFNGGVDQVMVSVFCRRSLLSTPVES